MPVPCQPSFFGLPLILAQQEAGDDHPRPVLPDEGPPAGEETTSTTGTPGTPGDVSADGGQAGADSGWMSFLPILVVIVVFYVILMAGQRKEKKKRKELLASVRKGDRVQTVGGILGTVTEVRDDAIIVKVDENNNTRLKIARAAIQSIENEEEGESEDES